MTVMFNTMYVPDIEDMSEAIDAVTLYEWTIVDGFYGETIYNSPFIQGHSINSFRHILYIRIIHCLKNKSHL
jgi:hypothetical protein